MKKSITILCMIAIAILIPAGVLANAVTRNIEVSFRNIRIFIDGEELIARDGAGNRVEPFIYEGTTYLPVRAIAEAFDKDVVWDAGSAFIHLNTPGSPTTPTPTLGSPLLGLLDWNATNVNIRQYSNLTNNGGGYTADIDGVSYPNSLRIGRTSGITASGSEGERAVFNLNGEYTLLTGHAAASGRSSSGNNTADIRIFGDDELLATYSFTTAGIQPISVDVTGVQILTIRGRNTSGSAFETLVLNPHIR
ncbi:MAG: hypothetical protein LBI27_07975 [Clostridiales bacterium]|nr:hypothetical protein [Clostridiales bacterium]